MSTPTVPAKHPSAPTPAAPKNDTKASEAKPQEAIKASEAKPQEDTKASEAKPQEDTKALSLKDIEGAFMLPAELSEAAAPVRARNEKQQAMDAKVKELHAAWVKAERPTAWPKMVEKRTVATYFVEPEKVSELHKIINRAVALHGTRARMGTSFQVTEKHVAAYNLPKHYVGRQAVSFAVMDKRPRATSDGKPASEVVNKPSNTPAK